MIEEVTKPVPAKKAKTVPAPKKAESSDEDDDDDDDGNYIVMHKYQ